MFNFDTAANIINDAAVEVGLAAVADPFGSTDPNFIQLCKFLKRIGRELMRDKEEGWSHLRGTCSLTTVVGQNVYPLPTDFVRMMDQTGWNRTSRFPLGGPASPQEWEFLSARLGQLYLTLVFRQNGQAIEVNPNGSVPDAQNVVFQYITSNWVSDDGGTTWSSATPSAYTQTLGLDPNLLVCALKLKFLEAKGFDTSVAEKDFAKALEQAKNDDSPAQILRVGARESPADDFLLDIQNIPLTGFGT